jgi:hypothetical protein
MRPHVVLPHGLAERHHRPMLRCRWRLCCLDVLPWQLHWLWHCLQCWHFVEVNRLMLWRLRKLVCYRHVVFLLLRCWKTKLKHHLLYYTGCTEIYSRLYAKLVTILGLHHFYSKVTGARMPSSLGLVSIAHDSLVCLRTTPCAQ